METTNTLTFLMHPDAAHAKACRLMAEGHGANGCIKKATHQGEWVSAYEAAIDGLGHLLALAPVVDDQPIDEVGSVLSVELSGLSNSSVASEAIAELHGLGRVADGEPQERDESQSTVTEVERSSLEPKLSADAAQVVSHSLVLLEIGEHLVQPVFPRQEEQGSTGNNDGGDEEPHVDSFARSFSMAAFRSSLAARSPGVGAEGTADLRSLVLTAPTVNLTFATSGKHRSLSLMAQRYAGVQSAQMQTFSWAFKAALRQDWYCSADSKQCGWSAIDDLLRGESWQLKVTVDVIKRDRKATGGGEVDQPPCYVRWQCLTTFIVANVALSATNAIGHCLLCDAEQFSNGLEVVHSAIVAALLCPVNSGTVLIL